jgi:NADH-ubiquinone oxidoreductase chain 6
MKNIILNLLALGAILSSILVITSKNPVISVLYLISVFINTAGYLILLGIGFVGIAYILVYIGAIAVLFLFVIMMINIKLVDILEVGREYTKNLPLALSIGGLFLYEIISITNFTINNVSLLPLNIFINFNKFFLLVEPLHNSYDSVWQSFVTLINSVLNPIAMDINFTNFLQIEILGQGLYTYGAMWLILSSIILLLSMIAPIILSTPSSANAVNAKN